MAGPGNVGVVGAGITGLATAYALLEQGAEIRVYESGVPGNAQSGGDSRLFRHAHDDPRLIDFARASRAVWEEWGERLGVELVSRDGAVAIGARVEGRLPLLEQADGMRVRGLEPGELGELLPLLAEYDGPAMLDEAGGAIRARAAVEALVRELGDALVDDEVISLRVTRTGEVEVRSGGASATHERVVVCGGRGTAALARAVGLSLPVRLGAHARSTFTVRADAPERLACLQDSSGLFGEPATYGAPAPGNRRYSLGVSEVAGVHEDGSLVDPAALAAMTRRASAYVSRALPGLDPEPVAVRHCWVTDLPWGSDALAVWEADGILFLAGNNLFKHAPALGRALARAALGEELAADLRPEAQLGRPGGGPAI